MKVGHAPFVQNVLISTRLVELFIISADLEYVKTVMRSAKTDQTPTVLIGTNTKQ